MPSRLEPEYEQEYTAWKSGPSLATRGAMLRKLEPAIQRGIQAHVGPSASPVLGSHARRLALAALETYDPRQARLGTHVINQLQGLKRIARKQQQVLTVPERVSLDLAHVHRSEVELEERLGRSPSLPELADYTGLSPKRLQHVRSYRTPLAEGALLAPADEEDQAGMPAVVDSNNNSRLVVEAVYGDLDPINQQILDRSLGLHGHRPQSVTAIARRLRMSPSAISQRRALVQRKLDEMASLRLFG